MSGDKRQRGRPRGRQQPRHRLTPVWARDFDPDQHARVLLSIVLARLDEQQKEPADEPHLAAEKKHKKGGDHHGSDN